MSSRAQKDKGQKQNSNQVILSELLKEEENRYCSDCGAKGIKYGIRGLRSSSVTGFALILPENSYFLVADLSCFSYYRAAMGVMESGCFSLYPLCRDTSKLGCSYFESEVRQP